MAQMKECPHCHHVLPRDKFYTRETGKPASWCKDCIRRANRARFLTEGGRERQRAGMRRYRYGLSDEEHMALIEEQGGLCAICRRPPDGKGGLHIDHDHISGAVRGLLCASCNMGLGQFRENPDVLNNAITYLHYGYVGADA